jgi:signal peptidase I
MASWKTSGAQPGCLFSTLATASGWRENLYYLVPARLWQFNFGGPCRTSGASKIPQGDDIIKLQVKAGDHLFVDRLAYNFRAPERGEIIVFETKGIPEENRLDFGIPGDQFYIKRLVGLGNELVQIGSDRHLVIDGKRLDSSTPHFGRIYSFDPTKPGRDSEFSGHYKGPGLSRYFSNHPDGVKIPPKSFMAMGDNTMNSLDSRSWGPFPSQYVIGRSFFVYWPITDRFGWGYRR